MQQPGDDADVQWLREELRLARRELKLIRTEGEHLAESLARARRQRARWREHAEVTSAALAAELSERWWAEQRTAPQARRSLRRRAGRADGTGEGATPARAEAAEQEMVRLVEATDLFDGGWYLRRYPGVARRRISPAVHYVRRGNELGHDPSERFRTAPYLVEHPEAAADGIPALVHHLRS